ncbi:MAG: bacillithiol biosynthesis deacetylase BshB1 [Planctomycetota bacterium]
MKLDVLVVAAHPDDAEISVGGTMLRLSRARKRVGVVDLTRGEMGTRGSAADRARETEAASALLGLAVRHNLDLPDGRVLPTIEARERLAAIIREHQPEVLLAHSTDDLHPDHRAAGELGRAAWYLSGLAKLGGGTGDRPARRPQRLYHFMGHVPFEPTLVVDIGPVWEEKVRLVRCYSTQLAPAGAQDRGQHFLFGADILARMQTKARAFGERIGVRYGEPLLHLGPLPCFDPLLAPLIDER